MLDRHSPVLHLVQLVRDEAHRFAVTFHRKRRQMRDRKTELLEIPGVGERTTKPPVAALRQLAGGEGGGCRGAGVGGEPSASGRDSALFSQRRTRSLDTSQVFRGVEISSIKVMAMDVGSDSRIRLLVLCVCVMLLVWIVGFGFDRLLAKDGVTRTDILLTSNF